MLVSIASLDLGIEGYRGLLKLQTFAISLHKESIKLGQEKLENLVVIEPFVVATISDSNSISLVYSFSKCFLD